MRYKTGVLFTIILIFAIMTAACGGGSDTEKTPESGKALFEKSALGSGAGCKTCHSLEPGVVIIGPSLAEIGNLAGSRLQGKSAEAYLEESILNPDAYLVEGYPAGVMPKTYASHLTSEEVDSLVAFMLTQK